MARYVYPPKNSGDIGDVLNWRGPGYYAPVQEDGMVQWYYVCNGDCDHCDQREHPDWCTGPSEMARIKGLGTPRRANMPWPGGRKSQFFDCYYYD